MYTPDFQRFSELAQQGNMVPVYREIIADRLTPVSAFEKVSGASESYLGLVLGPNTVSRGTGGEVLGN